MVNREKSELGDIAAAKIKQITAELEAAGSNQFDPVERIRTGFVHFKKEKLEYVNSSKLSLIGFVLAFHFSSMERQGSSTTANNLYIAFYLYTII